MRTACPIHFFKLFSARVPGIKLIPPGIKLIPPSGIKFKSDVPYVTLYLADKRVIKIKIINITGGITITDIEPSEIIQHIRERIKKGLDDEYLDIVKELEKSFYPDDIAAAAIMLYAEQGGRQEVRRRTLSKAPFIPLRTKESLPRTAKRLPAVQPQSRSPGYGVTHRTPPAVQQQSRPVPHTAPRRSSPAAQPQSRPAQQGTPRRSPPGAVAQKSYGDKQKAYQGQKGNGGRGVPQGKRR
jgi:hypothetical protein